MIITSTYQGSYYPETLGTEVIFITLVCHMGRVCGVNQVSLDVCAGAVMRVYMYKMCAYTIGT
jgi:hypothetical protein